MREIFSKATRISKIRQVAHYLIIIYRNNLHRRERVGLEVVEPTVFKHLQILIIQQPFTSTRVHLMQIDIARDNIYMAAS
jgi:hypothetical protein